MGSLAEETARIVARLEKLFERRFNCADVDGLERLSGGASQEIWAFRAGGKPLILRRLTRVQESRWVAVAGVENEAAIMTLASQHGIPVPAICHVLEDKDDLGRGFVAERISGETLPRKILRDDELAIARGGLATACGTVLAQIHALPRDKLPQLPKVGLLERLDNLEAIYRDSSPPRPVVELALRWLRDRAELSSGNGLVHGDFRNGNLIIAQSGLRSVLDWEGAHLGDPMEDLGWLCTSTWRFGQIDNPVGGFGQRSDLFEAYSAQSGRAVDPAAVSLWEVAGSLRWVVTCIYMGGEFALGDGALERAAIARRASEAELDLLQAIAPRERV